MANYIPANGTIQHDIPTPLTLTALQTYVGGFIEFLELASGDLIVVNEGTLDENSFAEPNTTASVLAGRPIFGHAVLCEPEEIA